MGCPARVAAYVKVSSGFNDLIGLVIDSATGGEVTAHIDVGPQHLQPAGLVHGGVYAAAAEAMASVGAWLAAGGEKFVAGTSNHASFLRPITEGTIRAVARPRQQGRTVAVWDTDITDDEGRLCAAVRVSLAIRDNRS